MKVLFSIKPEFVKEIKKGRKKFEYRKRIFKNQDVSTVVVYATKPFGKVVGEFEIEDIIEDSPDTIWENTKNYSGVTKEGFYDYFRGKDTAFAIQIKSFIEYDRPLDLNVYDKNLKTAPQSFCYIE